MPNAFCRLLLHVNFRKSTYFIRYITIVRSIHDIPLLQYTVYIYSAQKKETFCPEIGKINFFINVGKIVFASLYHGRSFEVVYVPKSFGFLSFWENSGPVSGQKVIYLGHCI